MDEINQDAHWNQNLYFKTPSYAANYLLSISLQATLIKARNWYKTCVDQNLLIEKKPSTSKPVSLLYC